MSSSFHPRTEALLLTGALVISSALTLVGCGGGGASSTSSGPTALITSASGSSDAATSTIKAASLTATTVPPLTQRDAVRLAGQATFGATETLVAQLRTTNAAAWIAEQQQLPQASRYTSGGNDAIHTHTTGIYYCNQPANKSDVCWRDWFSSQPLVWDFYRNAVNQPDQLRQRVALALQQILVVSGLQIEGTYGLRRYQNNLLSLSFANYRDVLRMVALSPVMGEYLNNVNNDKTAPNENFARELLQLFAIGTCRLNADASLEGGRCQPTYDNTTVRNYAYALTGWTYPLGGKSNVACQPQGSNCRYLYGEMTPLPAMHDAGERALLSGATKPAGSSPSQALTVVLNSLMAHPNMPPFIGKQLIQALVRSNPSAGYVTRVAAAFRSGTYSKDGFSFGTGRTGDLAATVAAILLDSEARGEASPGATGGRLREPALMMAAVLRGLNGRTDGDALSWWWGETLRQHMFRPPSVFNFYPPDYPVPGTQLVGGAFGIFSANTSLERLNFVSYLVDGGGSQPVANVPNAVGTSVSLDAFDADAIDAAKLVDRLSLLAYGEPLASGPRSKVIEAVSWWTAQTDAQNWMRNRVKTAAFLVFSAPAFHIVR